MSRFKRIERRILDSRVADFMLSRNFLIGMTVFMGTAMLFRAGFTAALLVYLTASMWHRQGRRDGIGEAAEELERVEKEHNGKWRIIPNEREEA